MIDNQEYEAKIIQFDQAKKILFFEVNSHVYKVKIISSESDTTSLYLFNTRTQITVKTPDQKQYQEQYLDHAFIPSSRTIITGNTIPETAQSSGQKLSPKDKALTLKSPLAGRVIKVLVTPGQQVVAHQPIVIIESMKMENEICAPYNAFIKTLSITEGNLVQQNQVLVTFDEIQKEIEGENDGAAKNGYEQTAIQNR